MMKEREYLNSVLAIANLPTELAEETRARIAKLDEKNEKRKSTPTKTQKENEEIKVAILANITENNGKSIASAIGAALGISTQKASSLCKLLVDEKKLTVAEIKVKGGKVKEYTLVETATEETEDTAEESEN